MNEWPLHPHATNLFRGWALYHEQLRGKLPRVVFT